MAGFGLMGKTRDLLTKYNTTVQIEVSSALITEGVFSKTRNPMYCGMFLFLLGFLKYRFRNLISISIPFIFILLVDILFYKNRRKTS